MKKLETFNYKFASRTYWWGSLALFLISILAGLLIYESGLSLFLKRASAAHTAFAVLLVAIFAAVLAYASYRRGQAIGASWKLHIWLLFLPIWILTLGLVPKASQYSSQPLQKARNFVVGGICLISVIAAAIYFFTGWGQGPRLPTAVQTALKNPMTIIGMPSSSAGVHDN